MKSLLNSQVLDIATISGKLDFKNESIYTQWLAQTYYFVRHSTRLLNLSAALTPFELQFFHLRANEHAHEEKSHEKLLEMDLKQLGYSISSFDEFPVTQCLYQSQYYAIQHTHPLSFLGYVALLETLPLKIGKQLLTEIEPIYGHKASSFLRVHSQEDEDHMESLLKVFEQLPSNILSTIQNNLILSGYLYSNLIIEIGSKANLKLQAG